MSRSFLAPEVVQTSAMDCGPAALASLLAGFGVNVSYGRLREACQTDVDGTSIDTIEELARSLGLDADQILIPPDHVTLEGLPAIAVVRLPNGFTHFVVLWRTHGPFVQIMDPGGGRRWTTVRALGDELYVHTMPVPAEGFREYAASDDFLRPLRKRLAEIGVDGEKSIADALADPSWRSIGALDAVVRMVRALLRSSAVRAGEAAAMLARFYERAKHDPSVVPNDYWSVRAHDDPEQVFLRGAVLVRARGLRGADEEALPLRPDVRAALAEKPERPLRRLLSLVREDGLAAPLAVVCALALAAALVVLEALVFRGAIEVGDRLRLPEQRIGMGLAMLGLFALLFGLQIPLTAATLRLGRHLEARLRVAFLSKIPRLDDRYFHSRLTSDMAQRAHAIHALRSFPVIAAGFASATFSLVATAIGLVWLDPKSAISVIAVAVLSIALPLALQPLWRDRDLRVQTHFGALTRFYLDALLGLTPLRAHGAERALRREHEGLLLEWERASMGLLRAAVSVDTVVAISGLLLTGWLVLGYLAGGGATAGALLLVYWALRIPALGQAIAQSARQYPHLRNVALRLFEPLGAKEHERPERAPDREGAAGIRYEGVTVRAGGHVVLEGVNVSIAPGEHVAIVGASGAGKSTLVGLLLGWHTPAEGRVLVDGAPLDAAHLDALRRRTSWVDPAIQLWNRTLVRNLRYGSDASRTPIARVIEDSELVGMLDQLPDGLQTVLGEGGALVSGGEGQRVRLGRAMMRGDARLVILDEPFRGLDREARRRMLRTSLERFRGATLICVTHDVADTATSFDRVLVVDGGRVVEDGSPAELLAREGSQYRALERADRALDAALWEAGEFRRVAMVAGMLSEGEPP